MSLALLLMILILYLFTQGKKEKTVTGEQVGFYAEVMAYQEHDGPGHGDDDKKKSKESSCEGEGRSLGTITMNDEWEVKVGSCKPLK